MRKGGYFMKINGYCLYIKEQRHFDGDFEEAFNGNLLTEEMTLEIIREHMKKGNPLKIICGANIIKGENNE